MSFLLKLYPHIGIPEELLDEAKYDWRKFKKLRDSTKNNNFALLDNFVEDKSVKIVNMFSTHPDVEDEYSRYGMVNVEKVMPELEEALVSVDIKNIYDSITFPHSIVTSLNAKNVSFMMYGT